VIDPLIKATPWVTKIGHEMTFLPTKQFSDHIKCTITDGIDKDITYDRHQKFQHKSYTKLLKDNNVVYDKCHRDDHVIEVSSKPIKSWTSFISWNKKIRALAKQVNLTPEVDWVGGGMGHHHIDYQEPAVLDNLFRIVAARPYLGWIFVHPSDKKNAVSLASWFIDLKTKRYWYEQGNLYFGSSVHEHIYPSGRGNVLSVRPDYLRCKTIEWRGFDSAVDMKMQIEHTAFLQALVKHAQDTATVEKKTQLFKSVKVAKKLLDDYASDFDKCAKDFYEFIEVLGLSKERYERYVETNLKARIEWKTTI
jgi:hypothetical protein